MGAGASWEQHGTNFRKHTGCLGGYVLDLDGCSPDCQPVTATCKNLRNAQSCGGPCGQLDDGTDFYNPSSSSAIPDADFSFLGPTWTEARPTIGYQKQPLRPPDFVAFRTCSAARDDEAAPADVFTWKPRPVGWGSFGEVVVATHKQTGAKRAVKCISKAKLRQKTSADVKAWVSREADVLRRLDHPNIIRLYEVYENQANVYLVLELCEGGNLLEYVKKADGVFGEHEAAAMIWQLLSAVRHIHARGFVHRDVKLENCLLARKQPEVGTNDPVVKLVDFGLARELDRGPRPGENPKTEHKLSPRMGTRKYMSPEAVENNVSVCMADRVDVWALGVCLHVLLFKMFPADEPRTNEVGNLEVQFCRGGNSVSAAAEDVLSKMLTWDPRRRVSVSGVMRHPWFTTVAAGERAMILAYAHSLRPAVVQFAETPPLRRLALAALAHEADDADIAKLGRLHRCLELECDGELTREALESISRFQGSRGPAHAVASSLVEHFEAVDTNHSGAIDWKDLAAIALGASTGVSSPTAKAASTVLLREDACLRAFEILSQGSEKVSIQSLSNLFAKTQRSNSVRASRRSLRERRRSSTGPGDADINKMLLDASGSGYLERDAFVLLVHGASGDRIVGRRLRDLHVERWNDLPRNL